MDERTREIRDRERELIYRISRAALEPDYRRFVSAADLALQLAAAQRQGQAGAKTAGRVLNAQIRQTGRGQLAPGTRFA